MPAGVTLPAPLAQAIAAALGQEPAAAERVSGGDLNDAWRVDLPDGTTAFVKTAEDAHPGSFAAEAQGLRWLGEPGALAVPEVLAVVDPPAGRQAEPTMPRLLALEWIDEARLDGQGEEELGRGLAAVHGTGARAFGGAEPLMLGPLAIPNEPCETWPEFYAERRLRPLAERAERQGSLPPGTREAIERICERMPELAGPPEPPARLHGDLWSGNVLTDRAGHPHLIDPAAHGGHREVDLAMLRLFGGPGERCFAAYHEAAPLADDHGERVALWQLFPLLVHATLFGGGYGSSVARAVARYA